MAENNDEVLKKEEIEKLVYKLKKINIKKSF